MRNNPELLAPAGGIRELKAAIQSGADAVYIGASSFSARDGAENFTGDKMREAVEYAHVYGAKVHCAINTLVKESELDKAIQTAISANECGVDAIIIQDIGLAQHIRKLLPDMELHASTQMTVTSLEGVRYLEEKGFSRVVLARELSLEEIEYISKNAKAETEVFVHGAICMSYSGQCLMSSILGGRSGNRGRCAQPCRLPYELVCDGKTCGSAYILSPKDLALINHLGKLKKAGVASLKIEGRLKSAEYVSAVVGIYRKYLDNPGTVMVSDTEELRNAFSRSGFTDGYLTGRLGSQMMSHTNPANNSGSTYSEDAKLRACGKFVRKIPIDIYASLCAGDVFRVTAYADNGLCAVCEGVQRAEYATNRPLDADRIRGQLGKLGDTPFYANNISVEAEASITVPIKEINEVRRMVCETLWKEFSKRPEKQITDVSPEYGINKSNEQTYLTAEVRTIAQGEAILASGGIRRVFASPDVAAELSGKCRDIEIVTKTSDILSDEDIRTNTVSVSSFGAMRRYADKAVYGEWRLNIYNSLTAREFSGLRCLTISPELNMNDIRDVVKHTDSTETEIIGYGHLPLMLMKNCPVKAMNKCCNGKSIYKLKDRKGIEFPILCSDDCNAVLLNSKPIYTADIIDEIKETGINCIRLNFTIETPSECRRIVQSYKAALNGIRQPSMPENTFTRGHLKRGV